MAGMKKGSEDTEYATVKGLRYALRLHLVPECAAR